MCLDLVPENSESDNENGGNNEIQTCEISDVPKYSSGSKQFFANIYNYPTYSDMNCDSWCKIDQLNQSI